MVLYNATTWRLMLFSSFESSNHEQSLTQPYKGYEPPDADHIFITFVLTFQSNSTLKYLQEMGDEPPPDADHIFVPSLEDIMEASRRLERQQQQRQ